METMKRLGKYLFLEEQEKSALGAMWRAAELAGGKVSKHFMIDLIDRRLAADGSFMDQFINQSLVSTKLEHPNVLRKIAAQRESGEAFAVYEHHEGFSLAKVLERCRAESFPFSIDHALLVASKLVTALAYAKGRHLTHGFVNPQMVFVTNEGEIKLKGFAFSAALRAASAAPALGPEFSAYAPQGMNPIGEDRDALDIFGCGAILYEMLTGVRFHEAEGDAAARIANATTGADNEKVPVPIVNILVSALDRSAPSAYRDIQKMSKDMEALLYSGEYSPTTFNLAFFMHSVFRAEMEEIAGKVAAEKKKSFAEPGAPPPVRSEEPTLGVAVPPPPVAPSKPQVETAKSGGGSKTPLIIGAAALVIVIVVLAVVFTGGGDKGQDKFEAARQELAQEGQRLEEETTELERERLEQENEALRQQLAEQATMERERRKQELEDEMKRTDEEIARLKAMEEQKQKQREIDQQLAALEEERAKLEAERKQRELEEEALRQKEAELAAQAKAEEDKPVEQEQPGDAPPTEAGDGAGDEAAPVEEPEPVEPEREEVVAPQPGSLVALDDPYLVRPTLQETYQILDAPRRAVRAGLVERDRKILFLVRALVDEKGEVEEAVLHSSPIKDGRDDYGMADRALRTVKRYNFTSPTKLGVKVKVWMIIPVHYRGR